MAESSCPLLGKSEVTASHLFAADHPNVGGVTVKGEHGRIVVGHIEVGLRLKAARGDCDMTGIIDGHHIHTAERIKIFHRLAHPSGKIHRGVLGILL
jgi:hypothetical protein